VQTLKVQLPALEVALQNTVSNFFFFSKKINSLKTTPFPRWMRGKPQLSGCKNYTPPLKASPMPPSPTATQKQSLHLVIKR
jgi:hypothetical protein